DGAPMTTSLSAAGEAQLAKIAEVTGGNVVRSERGTLGIETIRNQLKRMMSEELSDTVETVYADVYWIPLCVAIGLLGLEAATILIWSTLVRRRHGRTQSAGRKARASVAPAKAHDGGSKQRPERRKRRAAKA